MDVAVSSSALEDVEADVLVLAVAEPLELGHLQDLDSRVGGRLERLLADGELTGKRGKLTTLHLDGELKAKRLTIAGLGKTPDADALRTAAAAVAHGRSRTVAWWLDSPEQARAVVDGLMLGRYDAGRWKTEPEKSPPLETLILCGPGSADALDGARRAALVAGWTNRARDLVNAPPNALTPLRLAEVAGEIEERFSRISAEIMGPEEMEAAGMGALVSVAAGSHNPPRLITLRYEPETPADPELVLGLVGKGITFDSGGYSLKPAASQEDMKSDMGGAAAALSAPRRDRRARAARCACWSSSPRPRTCSRAHATRPGDVVRAADGTTIEVNNTDAEGRLVLADALLHARSEGATHLLDLATLTGAIEVALGNFYAGLFGNDDAWLERVETAAKASGDHAWLHAAPPRLQALPGLARRRPQEHARLQARRSDDRRALPPAVRGRGPVGAPRHRGHRVPRQRTRLLSRRRDRLRSPPRRRACRLPPRDRMTNGPSYDLSDEQQLLRSTVREFAEAQVAPVAEELDRDHRFPYEIVAGLAELGLMGVPIPEEYGGAGVDTLAVRDRRSRS